MQASENLEMPQGSAPVRRRIARSATSEAEWDMARQLQLGSLSLIPLLLPNLRRRINMPRRAALGLARVSRFWMIAPRCIGFPSALFAGLGALGPPTEPQRRPTCTPNRRGSRFVRGRPLPTTRGSRAATGRSHRPRASSSNQVRSAAAAAGAGGKCHRDDRPPARLAPCPPERRKAR